MKRICVAVLFIVGLGVAPTLSAQAPTFGVGLGLTMPMGDYGDVAGTGFHGTGQAAFGLGTGPVGVRVDVSYHRTGLDGGVDGSTSLLGGMANVVYNFQTAGQVKPYVVAGLGYYQVKLDVTGFGEADESNLAYGGGVGVNFALAAATLFAEVRYNSITSGDTFEATNFIPFTVGLRFGGK